MQSIMKFLILIIILVINAKCEDSCASAGQKCGGPNGISCCRTDDVLRCRHPDNNSNAYAFGTCVKTCKSEGQMCGGFAGFRCCSGMSCDAPKKCCDMAGKCVKE